MMEKHRTSSGMAAERPWPRKKTARKALAALGVLSLRPQRLHVRWGGKRGVLGAALRAAMLGTLWSTTAGGL